MLKWRPKCEVTEPDYSGSLQFHRETPSCCYNEELGKGIFSLSVETLPGQTDKDLLRADGRLTVGLQPHPYRFVRA